MKNSIGMILLVILLAISSNSDAAPEDFILKVDLANSCDETGSHKKPHFAKGQTISIARFKSSDEDYFTLESEYFPKDVRDSIKAVKLYYKSGTKYPGVLVNYCGAPKETFKARAEVPVNDEHLYGEIDFKHDNGSVETHKLIINQRMRNGERHLYIQNFSKSGNPIHGGRAHRP